MTEPSFGVRYRLGGGGCEWRQRIHRSHRLGGEVLLGPALYQPTDLLVGGGQHPAAIRIKVARADEDLIAVVECSHANGDRSEDLLFPHPRSIAGREQTPTTLTRTPLDPRADRRGSGCRWRLPAASSSEGQARGSRRPLLGGVLTSDLYWSGWRDLNPRPLRPERSALPSCATPRGMPSVIVADRSEER